MTKEEQIADILRNDPLLMSILLGGVYTFQEIGVEGIRRGIEGEDGINHSPTKDAFDDNGELLPCALVREGSTSPYGSVRSIKEKATAISQIISVYFFEMRGHELIEIAKRRSYFILEGVRLQPSYPIWMAFESRPEPDTGPVINSSTIRQDWMVVSMRKPT